MNRSTETLLPVGSQPAPPVPQFLIIDDDPLAIESLYAVLQDFREFRFATSGREGLALQAEKPADLVLLDANMPDLDGYATCEALKLDYPDTPVIFVTAASDPDSEIRALTVGAVDLIAKPLNPPLVRARVKTHLQLKQHSDLLRALLKRDPLTGIANRLSLDEQVAIEWRRALRNQSPLSVLMIDIDFFKAYNDCYGHPKGDACLRQVAQTIAAAVKRGGELAARYGGEEFAVLLPACTGQQALVLANIIGASV